MLLKINSPNVIFQLYFRLSSSWLSFFHSKTDLLFFNILGLFINLSAVASILSIMAKLSAVLK